MGSTPNPMLYLDFAANFFILSMIKDIPQTIGMSFISQGYVYFPTLIVCKVLEADRGGI